MGDLAEDLAAAHVVGHVIVHLDPTVHGPGVHDDAVPGQSGGPGMRQAEEFAVVGRDAAPRGPLELRPLEEITLVGTLAASAGVVAFVRIDGRLYPVRIGDRLGPDRGRVVRIDERRVELQELVQDASGAWAERITMLKIQESSR